jgi:radical SAM superfamily enzyme YgiQ (UPF0313 family)
MPAAAQGCVRHEDAVLDVLLVGAEELENLATRYLAAILRQAGFTVQLAAFSSEADGPDVVALACRQQPRVIGLSIIFQYRTSEFLRLAHELRAAVPTAHITTGGHFPTFADRELLAHSPDLDSVIRGEGEYALLELVRQLGDPGAWQGISGLTSRGAGRIVQAPSRPPIGDLDALPFPSRDTSPQQSLGIGFTPIIGSRGCFCQCSFCSIRAFYGDAGGPPQRFRSVPNLVAEMEQLYHEHGVRFFVFNDDEWFPASRARLGRVSALESELKARRLDVLMSIKCRADDVEPALFERLRDMGVTRAYVGVESGSDHSLRMLNKRTTVAQNERALEILHRIGILADFGMIFLDPDSTVDDVRANLAFFRRMASDGQAPLSFGRLEVYAGTPILARLTREGRLSGDFMAWNYEIADSRVELLFRLMYAAMRRRHYDMDGLAKQCSMACYRHGMYRFVMGDRAEPELAAELRSEVARMNANSLGMLDDMLRFVLSADIYNANEVNDQAARWAQDASLFDMRQMGVLAAWQEKLDRSVAGGPAGIAGTKSRAAGGGLA